jgi:hypothetical protein
MLRPRFMPVSRWRLVAIDAHAQAGNLDDALRLLTVPVQSQSSPYRCQISSCEDESRGGCVAHLSWHWGCWFLEVRAAETDRLRWSTLSATSSARASPMARQNQI